MATFGMNMSWTVCPTPDFHLVADPGHVQKNPEIYARLARESVLFTLGDILWRANQHLGVNLRVRYNRVRGVPVFSDDVTKGVGLGRGSVGTVAFSSLQVAVWLGFTEIYFLGLDLGGPHHHGQWPPNADIAEAQDPLFRFAADAITKMPLPRPLVWNVGSPDSKCTAFPKHTFDEAFPPK